MNVPVEGGFPFFLRIGEPISGYTVLAVLQLILVCHWPDWARFDDELELFEFLIWYMKVVLRKLAGSSNRDFVVACHGGDPNRRIMS